MMLNLINLSSYTDEESKDEMIIQTFHSLPMGDKFLVESDESFDTLLGKLEDRYTNVVEWQYIKEGPEQWQVVISKKAYNFI